MSKSPDSAPQPQLSFYYLRYLLRPRSFGRYVIIGGMNTTIGIGIFPFLYWLFGDSMAVNTLLVIGWVISTCFAFLTHKLVTFEATGAYHHEGLRFLILSVIILAINLSVMNLVMHFTTSHPVLVQVGISATIAGTLMILNYLGLDRIVFKSEKPKS